METKFSILDYEGLIKNTETEIERQRGVIKYCEERIEHHKEAIRLIQENNERFLKDIEFYKTKIAELKKMEGL